MASSTGKLCGPCEARYKTTTAVSWCMDCDEGLCSSCLEDHKVNKASEKHQTISVSQYVVIESVSSLIKQESKLNEKGTEIKSLGKTILPINEILSDVQVFLATKSLIEKLRKEQKRVLTLCNQNAAKESVLELSTDQQLNNLLSDLKYFGTIHMVRNPCQIETGAWEQPRAQLHVPITAVRDIDQTKLELIREISFENDFERNKVLVYTQDGQMSKSIAVDKYPFELVLINPHTVAVTCVEDKTINIVNIDDCVVKQKIKVRKPCCGLSYYADKLYALTEHTGIIEFDLAGNITRTIPVDVPNKKFIACYDNNGREIWRLDVADSGVTADTYGNYFASDFENGRLQMISADGKRTKLLLDLPEGNFMEGVFFDKNSSTLLVACGSRFARLYRVI
ncbi:unnamed protein product [Mytilus coruscus]|uniref:B box-type domain-containing protein n=1 Tax=Mytilus coruscus TaxID=42192 RepID=A0A6J8EBB1_MYTCO|nr:unnamed protein product [Mytilus coruscus]